MSRYNFREAFRDWFVIFRDELRTVFRDQGVVIFFILVPLAYPLLYTYIYNNETVREVPAVVVDEGRTQASREFVRRVDATADVKVVSHCANMEEAKGMVMRREAYGIIRLPQTFSQDLARMKQTSVSLYVDMSGMLYYKALLLSCTNVSLEMGARLKVMRSPGTTDEQDRLTQHPIQYQQVDIYNPQAGFASFLIPAVLILLLQQTLVLGVGLSAGTARERNSYAELLPINRHYHGLLRIVLGKGAAYMLVFLWNIFYCLFLVPKFFSLPQIGAPWDIWLVAIPFLVATTAFAMTCSVLIRQREAAFMIIVFCSVPLLFLTGVSWPGWAMPRFWKVVSWAFPSTFGVNAFVKVNTMGARLADVEHEVVCLWAQAAFYFGTTLLVYRNNIAAAARRLERKKEGIRQRLQERRGGRGAADGTGEA
ncbi:MAG: ABC transporter permease [Alloprevotella sp.]|nr:ABC transporter permease [Alloprevotella sp.]MBR1653106.1 ABC transporter permease [Alloprevotella sp.]